MQSHTALTRLAEKGRPDWVIQAQLGRPLANLGRAAATLMVNRMIATENFRVVDLAAFDEVKTEQTDVVAKAKQLGAKYVITGQITKFGKSVKNRGGVLGGVANAFLRGGLNFKQTAYENGITVRVVDASTAEVISSVTSDGIAVGDIIKTIGGLGGDSAGGVGGAFGSSASDEREKRIAESIQASVDRLVIQLVSVRERGDLAP